MRELKFRAWDKRSHNMIYGYPAFKNNGTLDCFHEFITGSQYGHGKEQGDWVDDVMQYTGIKDSKGQEIYEKDIVQIIWPAGLKDKYIVELRQFSDANFPKWSFWSMENRFNYCGSAGGDVEIIGNIYENPELLETEHG